MLPRLPDGYQAVARHPVHHQRCRGDSLANNAALATAMASPRIEGTTNKKIVL